MSSEPAAFDELQEGWPVNQRYRLTQGVGLGRLGEASDTDHESHLRLLVNSDADDFADDRHPDAAAFVVLALNNGAAAFLDQDEIGATIGPSSSGFADLVIQAAEGLPDKLLELLPGHGTKGPEIPLPRP